MVDVERGSLILTRWVEDEAASRLFEAAGTRDRASSRLSRLFLRGIFFQDFLSRGSRLNDEEFCNRVGSRLGVKLRHEGNPPVENWPG